VNKLENTSFKLALITLGCSKNSVDSEVLAGAFKANGIDVFHADSYENADAVLINTCGFILDAKTESVDVIIDCLNAKAKGLISKVFVMGCMVQRYIEELKHELPEVDGFFGLNKMEDIISIISGKMLSGIHARVISTPAHYAFIKISEGCNRKCSFCAIPMIRGKHISRPAEEIVEEAKMLAGKGVKELIVIAQDTTFYGKDLYGKRMLGKLLSELSNLNEFEWIRLHYTYPSAFPLDILDVMREHPDICNYLDIPLQHVSDRILKLMKRNIDGAGTRKLIDKLRNKVPGLAIRTTFITGFPGETSKEHKELRDFIVSSEFERLGVFIYSPEEGTAAYKIKPEVSERIKNLRLEELMAVQQDISLNHNLKLIGKKLKVLIDRKEGDFFVGRTEFDSPGIDNEVLVKPHKSIIAGEFSEVMITAAEEFDLYGEC